MTMISRRRENRKDWPKEEEEEEELVLEEEELARTPPISRTHHDFHPTTGHPHRPVTEQVDVKVFPYKHALPVHTKVRPSILAKEAPAQNYRGFITLAMLVLAATNLRLMIENFLKYGVLFLTQPEYISEADWGWLLTMQGFLQLTCYLGLGVEKLLVEPVPSTAATTSSSTKTSPTESNRVVAPSSRQRIWSSFHWLNILVTLAVPTYIVYYHMYHPLLGCLTMTHSIVLALKLISFVCVHNDFRHAYRSGEPTQPYPDNLTLSNYYYFQVAPTLCYQVSYPRTPSIRYGFLFKRIAEYLLSTLLMYFLAIQYAAPTLKNSLTDLKGTEDPPLVFIIERVLKLSTISVLMWLLGFYSIFHSFLNALAEVLRFGDRNFYLPWWNSSSLSEYWRLWNQPVHHWMKRHLYVPGISQGYPQWLMLGVTFLFSAIFHELLFGVAVHALQGYAFWGMLGQIPLIMVSSLLKRWRGPDSSAGNVVFWLAFCIIGQPCLVVLYYYDWSRRNPSPQGAL